jgi:hypothetical protein
MIKLKHILSNFLNEALTDYQQNLIGTTVDNYTGLNWYQRQNRSNTIRSAQIIGFLDKYTMKLKDLNLNRVYVIEIDPETHKDFLPVSPRGTFVGKDQIGNTWRVYSDASTQTPDWKSSSIENTNDPLLQIKTYDKYADKKFKTYKKSANLVIELLDQIRKAILLLPSTMRNVSSVPKDYMYVLNKNKLKSGEPFDLDDLDKAKEKVESLLLPYIEDALRSSVSDLKNEDNEDEDILTVNIASYEKDNEGWDIPILAGTGKPLSVFQIKQLVDKMYNLNKTLPAGEIFSDDTSDLIDDINREISNIVNVTMN